MLTRLLNRVPAFNRVLHTIPNGTAMAQSTLFRFTAITGASLLFFQYQHPELLRSYFKIQNPIFYDLEKKILRMKTSIKRNKDRTVDLTEFDLYRISNYAAEAVAIDYINEMKVNELKRAKSRKENSDVYEGLILRAHHIREDSIQRGLNQVLKLLRVTRKDYDAAYQKLGGDGNFEIRIGHKLDFLFFKAQTKQIEGISRAKIIEILKAKAKIIDQMMKIERIEKARNNMLQIQAYYCEIDYDQISDFMKVLVDDQIHDDYGVRSAQLFLYKNWDSELVNLEKKIEEKYAEMNKWIESANQ